MSSPAHAAFLRGMNVGGHRLTNDELRGALRGDRLRSAWRRSARAATSSSRRRRRRRRGAPGAHRAGLAGGARLRGPDVHPHRRGGARDRRRAAVQRRSSSLPPTGKLQVALLGAAPAREVRAQRARAGGREDRLAFGARELYWLPSGGVLESALDMKAIERLLGSMTMRTKGTIEQIASKHFAG